MKKLDFNTLYHLSEIHRIAQASTLTLQDKANLIEILARYPQYFTISEPKQEGNTYIYTITKEQKLWDDMEQLCIEEDKLIEREKLE